MPLVEIRAEGLALRQWLGLKRIFQIDEKRSRRAGRRRRDLCLKVLLPRAPAPFLGGQPDLAAV